MAASQPQVKLDSEAGGPPGVPGPAGSDGRKTLLALAGSDDSRDTSSLQQQSGRQLIVEAWVSLEVGEIDGVVRQVEAIAGQRGGWVESADIVGEAGYRTATINVRVPADRFGDAMQTLRGLGRVTDEGVSSTDVTDRLIDNEARMTAWKTQEERLIVLLENAATVEDVIDIERRISEVRADIESVAATQRNLENRVAASLIRVHLASAGAVCQRSAQRVADPGGGGSGQHRRQHRGAGREPGRVRGRKTGIPGRARAGGGT